MRAYVIRRLLLLIPTLLLLSILVFLSVRFIPGDVIDAMAGRLEALGAGANIDREAVERMLGLDQPVYVQYGRWMGGILLRGTLGNSLLGDWSVEEAIGDRLPLTIELGVLSVVMGLLIAVPVGIYSALRRNTAADYVGRSFAVIGLATPNFWLALMVMIFPVIIYLPNRAIRSIFYACIRTCRGRCKRPSSTSPTLTTAIASWSPYAGRTGLSAHTVDHQGLLGWRTNSVGSADKIIRVGSSVSASAPSSRNLPWGSTSGWRRSG